MLLKPTMPFLGRAAATALAAAFVQVTVELIGACGGDLGPARAPGPPAAPYTARDAQLFDDAIEGQALGYEIGQAAGKDARLLPDRVDGSDGVVRARVVTVTSKTEDSGTGLQLSMHALETLAGHRAPTGDFILYASAKSPAAGLLRAAEERLVGLTLVAFVKGFAAEGGDGDGVMHFHLAGDDKDEQDRVRAASLGTFH
jgi:hypothetical protein